VAIVLGKALFYRQLEQGLVVARKQHDEVVGDSLHIIWSSLNTLQPDSGGQGDARSESRRQPDGPGGQTPCTRTT